MAKKMDYTCPETGATYPESYWIPAIILLMKSDKTGVVTFYGYASHTARQEGKAEISEKNYRITPALYDQYFSPAVQNVEDENPHSASYALAMATLEDGVSFFDGADDV